MQQDANYKATYVYVKGSGYVLRNRKIVLLVGKDSAQERQAEAIKSVEKDLENYWKWQIIIGRKDIEEITNRTREKGKSEKGFFSRIFDVFKISDAVNVVRDNAKTCDCDDDLLLLSGSDLHLINTTLNPDGGGVAMGPPNGAISKKLYLDPTHFFKSVPQEPQLGNDGGSFLVGIIDSGINFGGNERQSHRSLGYEPFISSKIESSLSYNFIRNNTEVIDSVNHGTKIARIVVRNTSSEKIKLVALKTFNKDKIGNLYDNLCAVIYAMKHNMRIVNASWGASIKESIPVFDEVLRRAKSANMVVVCSAGNEKKDIDLNPYYPACYADHSELGNYVITVTSKNDSVCQNKSGSGKKIDLTVKTDKDCSLRKLSSRIEIDETPLYKSPFFRRYCYHLLDEKDYPRAFENYQKALSAAPIGFKSKNSFDNPTVTNLKVADFKTYYLTTLTDKADTWLEYYKTTKQKENLKIALDTYVTADKLIDLMRFEHTGTQSKLYWRNKTHHLYVQAIETCFLLKNYEKAFYFFEKSKAVLLNDQLNGLSANQQLSATDLAQEKGFQQAISELNKKIASEAENSKNYAVLQSQLLENQSKQEQFIKRLETKNPTYFKYKYDTTLVSLDKVKKYLAKDQTVLEYFMGDDDIYALIISHDKTDLQKIPLLDYSKNAKQFLIYCADNQKINQYFPNFLLVSNQIYQQIFRYLNVPKGRLIITQDGYFLPFEALSKSSKRSEYLLNDYAISYTYSVQFLLKNLGKKSFSFSHKFMGMSPVNYGKNLNQTSLSGSDISLTEVASNFVFGKKFSAKEATKNAFLTHAKDYKIVHLYTHAQADSTDQEPMIYFADSVLKLSELNALERFKTQLLVLSACKTAVGKNAKGEGILSLSRGFAALGVPATLTTLWSVENQSTYTLNELFYRYLSKGYPKDVSLQKAKIEFLQSQSGEKQLPTFWAAAVLVGDAEAVSLSNGWIYLGVVGLLGLLILFLWYKKTH